MKNYKIFRWFSHAKSILNVSNAVVKTAKELCERWIINDRAQYYYYQLPNFPFHRRRRSTVVESTAEGSVKKLVHGVKRLPRRWLSPNEIFYVKHRNAVREELEKNGTEKASWTQVRAACSQKWRNLPSTTEERQSYIDKSKRDRNRYDRELAEQGVITGPVTSYAYFVRDRKGGTYGQSSDRLTLKSVNLEWQQLNDVQKQKYKKMAEADRLRYYRQVDNNNNNCNHHFQPIRQSQKREQGQLADKRNRLREILTANNVAAIETLRATAGDNQQRKMSSYTKAKIAAQFGRPKSPPRPYPLFVQDYWTEQSGRNRNVLRQNIDTWSTDASVHTDAVREQFKPQHHSQQQNGQRQNLADIWKNDLSPETKRAYSDRYKSMMASYQMKLDAWKAEMKSKGQSDVIRILSRHQGLTSGFSQRYFRNLNKLRVKKLQELEERAATVPQ